MTTERYATGADFAARRRQRESATRRRAWMAIGIGALVVAGVAVFSTLASSGPPQVVWTDWHVVATEPGGSPIRGFVRRDYCDFGGFVRESPDGMLEPGAFFLVPRRSGFAALFAELGIGRSNSPDDETRFGYDHTRSAYGWPQVELNSAGVKWWRYERWDAQQ